MSYFWRMSFLRRYATQESRGNLMFAPDALRAIERHSWPGNVRELQNRVRRAVIMASGTRVNPKDLELDAAKSAATSGGTTLRQAQGASRKGHDPAGT